VEWPQDDTRHCGHFTWISSTKLSHIGAAIGTYLVPLALTDLDNGPTMVIGAVVTLLGAGISIMWAPETRGLTLGVGRAGQRVRPKS
jgi:hypothetical protein